jgi:hypothetical protein
MLMAPIQALTTLADDQEKHYCIIRNTTSLALCCLVTFSPPLPLMMRFDECLLKLYEVKEHLFPM